MTIYCYSVITFIGQHTASLRGRAGGPAGLRETGARVLSTAVTNRYQFIALRDMFGHRSYLLRHVVRVDQAYGWPILLTVP